MAHTTQHLLSWNFIYLIFYTTTLSHLFQVLSLLHLLSGFNMQIFVILYMFPCLHLPTCTHPKRILYFLYLHISFLTGNSINFSLSYHQQLGLSNLGIFTLWAPVLRTYRSEHQTSSRSWPRSFTIHPCGKL